MKRRRWRIAIPAAAGSGAGVLLALWSAPDRYTPAMTDLWCAGVVCASVTAAVTMTTIRNRYLR